VRRSSPRTQIANDDAASVFVNFSSDSCAAPRRRHAIVVAAAAAVVENGRLFGRSAAFRRTALSDFSSSVGVLAACSDSVRGRAVPGNRAIFRRRDFQINDR